VRVAVDRRRREPDAFKQLSGAGEALPASAAAEPDAVRDEFADLFSAG